LPVDEEPAMLNINQCLQSLGACETHPAETEQNDKSQSSSTSGRELYVTTAGPELPNSVRGPACCNNCSAMVERGTHAPSRIFGYIGQHQTTYVCVIAFARGAQPSLCARSCIKVIVSGRVTLFGHALYV